MALCLGLLEPLKQYGVSLKWPNDFILKSRKVGGMLIENVWNGDELVGVILGFGLNVNTQITEDDELFFTATSLKSETGKEVDKDKLLQKLLVSLEVFYARWKSGDFKHIYNEWKSNQVFMNQNISVHTHNNEIKTGIMKNLLENGDLVLLCDDGSEEIIPFYLISDVCL